MCKLYAVCCNSSERGVTQERIFSLRLGLAACIRLYWDAGVPVPDINELFNEALTNGFPVVAATAANAVITSVATTSSSSPSASVQVHRQLVLLLALYSWQTCAGFLHMNSVAKPCSSVCLRFAESPLLQMSTAIEVLSSSGTEIEVCPFLGLR